jgi:hypothetical protein
MALPLATVCLSLRVSRFSADAPDDRLRAEAVRTSVRTCGAAVNEIACGHDDRHQAAGRYL